MEQRFLIDTNVIIDVFGDVMPNNIKQKIVRMLPIVSAVTYMEALGWHQASSSQLSILQKFMDVATILPINQQVMDTTVQIRQQKKIGLGDAIIAATAIFYNKILVTQNTSDFKSIDKLTVFNTWE